MAKRRIAVLGGGMGSLSAVYWLTSEPGWQERFEITVYQLGWRLGGKAASARQGSDFDRSLEHGYHVLLGFYDNAFATMRECYKELGRDPASPFSAFAATTYEEERLHPERYAFHRHTTTQIAQEFGGQTHFLPFDLPRNALMPGDSQEVEPWSALGLLLDGLVLAATGRLFTVPDDPEAPPPPHPGLASWMHEEIERVLQGAETSVDRWIAESEPLHVAAALWKKLAASRAAGLAIRGAEHVIVALVKAYMRALWKHVQPRIATDWTAYRDWIFQDTFAANLCGILDDDLLRCGFDAVNDENYLDWWMRHAAVPEGALITARSSLGQFPYDLVFGYRNGDTQSPPGPGKPTRGSPDMEAGTMLKGLFYFVLAYKGAPEWMPQAGFGELLVAPVYEVLKRRGVRIEFFRRVRALHLDAEKRGVARIAIERQATVKSGTYEPLFPVGPLSCWPLEPFYDQLVEGEALKAQQINLESWWTPWQGPIDELVRGRDFDLVLLGISIAALPYLCSDLVEASEKWRQMVTRIETNRPLIVQTWFTKSLAEMGWTTGVMNGDNGTQPINLQTSMDQVLAQESWPPNLPPGVAPKSLIYYSGVMPDDPHQPPAPDAAYPPTQHEALRVAAVDWIAKFARVYCPAAAPNGRFDWNVLASVKDPSRQGPARFDAQYWRVNIDPSERYVLSVTGSSRYRLDAGGSGFDNLYLTGDWIHCGLDAGCMEATVASGIEASRAISGYPVTIDGERKWKPEGEER
jgi:uncharacterized protein with NAD-binding domain and iron-sulfur cluster